MVTACAVCKITTTGKQPHSVTLVNVRVRAYIERIEMSALSAATCQYCDSEGKYYGAFNAILCTPCLSELLGCADSPQPQIREKKDRRTNSEKMCDTLLASGFKEDKWRSGKYRVFETGVNGMLFYVGKNGALRVGKNQTKSNAWTDATKKRLISGEKIAVIECPMCLSKRMLLEHFLQEAKNITCFACKHASPTKHWRRVNA